MEFLSPAGWPRPKGYAHGVAATGEIIFVSGQVGWNSGGIFASDDLAAQVRQALENVASVLAAGGAAPQHVARMTWYVTDKDEYLRQQREIGEAYRAVMGKHFPAISVVEVSGLVEDRAKVEIEATAVVQR
jgi:enamine deaminase RidA (YjgF/YER057c/UK114 family)